MSTIEFKVHTQYNKSDILKMEKISIRKFRKKNMLVTGIAFLLYGAFMIYKTAAGITDSLFWGKNILDWVLLTLLAMGFGISWAFPYFQTSKIIKAGQEGKLKANFYFHKKYFQYGWGGEYNTISYRQVQEFLNLDHTFYIKADQVSYWIKKEDFEIGTPEAFYTFMLEKLDNKCIK